MRIIPVLLTLWFIPMGQTVQKTERPRARETGLTIGVLLPGPLNAITDVSGVQVGHRTIVRGDDIRTGLTAILPHGGNLFREKVPGAVFVGNGFGKLAGSTQIAELGEIETPILLTSTLSVPRVADALIDYMLALPGNEDVRSINPLVAETNDGLLNDIRGRHINRDDVIAAIKNSGPGAVEEGAVGAGTGTVAFGFKGGIGTSSRRMPDSLGGYTVGILVQTNFGGVLTIAGAPVGRELGRYYLKEELERSTKGKQSGTDQEKRSTTDRSLPGMPSVAAPVASPSTRLNENLAPGSISGSRTDDSADGSVIVVIATDAPLDSRNLGRLAARAMMGLARTGSSASNGSGDYAIAFSTAPSVRIRSGPGQARTRQVELLSNDAMSPLFLAVIEATEEAVYNSLFRATDMTGRGRKVEALPIDRTLEILRKYGLIPSIK